MNAVPEFTDDITTFSVAGEAATIDPVTGLITIAADAMTFTVAGEGILLDPVTGLFTVSADALGAGVAALVTATDSAGGATGGFRMVITATAAPEVIVPPKLLGTGLIGAAVTLDPGVWSGAPTPALTFQWQRDGVDIAGALAAVYVPGPADDGAALRCAVTARNTAGSLVAVTEPLDVTDSVVTAPLPVGTIPGVVYAQDSGDQVVSAQAGFIGENLVYALVAAPAGVTIQAGSGLVTIPTAAPITDATITVRASNSGGSATQSFTVTVSTVTVFDTAGKLGDLGFVFDTAAPSWTLDAGAGKLIPAATGRAHGLWSKAAGDGRYRCLARWGTTDTTTQEYAPFVLGARIARSGGNFTGVYVEAFRPASGTKQLRLQQYTGVGAETKLLASVTRTWGWTIWYWVELEIDGAVVKARLYPEAGPAPDWQVQASTSVTGASGDGFGPGGLPLQGISPTIRIKRLEFYPLGA